MNTNLLYAWAAVAALISLCGLVAACVLAFLNRRRSSRAARLVFIALGINIISRIASWIMAPLATQFLAPNQLGMWSVMLSPVWAILGVISLILFVRAAFIDREESAEIADFSNVESTGDGPAIPPGDANPYAVPR